MCESCYGGHQCSCGDRATSCTIVSDTYEEVTNQPCGSTVTYYEAFTTPLPTVEIMVRNNLTSCIMTVIIRRGHRSTIRRRLNPDETFDSIVGDVKSISLRCQDGTGPCEGSIRLNIHYSVCC